MKLLNWQGVLVFAEIYQGKIADISLEILGKGEELAKKLNSGVFAVTVDAVEESEFLIGHGADIVYALETRSASQIDDLRYTDAICQLIEEIRPAILLIGATTLGKSIAPRIASKLGTGLTADCIELKIDEKTGNLLQIRPAFQDSLLATIACPDKRPQIATVREKIFQIKSFDKNRRGEIIPKQYALKEDTKLEIIDQTETGMPAEKMGKKILFGIGRGIGSRENIELVKRVAERYGAEIGATRGVVNEGWIEKEYQIGQTGITVRPKVYIACGISGAIQHLCGIQGTECIIAINTDRNAPIFKVADVGIHQNIVDVLNYLHLHTDSEKTFA